MGVHDSFGNHVLMDWSVPKTISGVHSASRQCGGEADSPELSNPRHAADRSAARSKMIFDFRFWTFECARHLLIFVRVSSCGFVDRCLVESHELTQNKIRII